MNEAKGKGKKATSCDRCHHIKAKCERPGDAPKTRRRKREEQTSPRGAKKKQVRTKSPEPEVEGEEEEPRDAFGVFTEVMASLVGEMCMIRGEMERANNQRANQAERMLFQTERMISELEDIRVGMDPDYTPEQLAKLIEGGESDVEELEQEEEEEDEERGEEEEEEEEAELSPP
ncbi:hypothetical protein BU15DRAFT_79596 [Melanogaster broomeanus]|nr:hypothetical protein BU15DRAFT_79596 [Melanogaster broomeanus]